jgi:hypothetical protein
VQQLTWDKTCKPLFYRRLGKHCPEHQAHLRLVLLDEEGKLPDHMGFPAYIKHGHEWATIGLRFKTYSLRTLHDAPRPACLWCNNPSAECGAHLITCPHLPATLKPGLHLALLHIHAQHNDLPPPAEDIDPSTLPLDAHTRTTNLRRLTRLTWDNMYNDKHLPKKDRITIKVLYYIGTLINTYRLSWEPTNTQTPHDHPILPIAFPP